MDVKDPGFRYALGIPLVEVFSVRVTKTVGDDRRSEIYGVVQFSDSRGTDVLYDREIQNSESVSSSNETVTLTSPPRCISALKDFVISLNLKDKTNQDHLEVEDSSEIEIDYNDVSNGRIDWNLSRNSKLELYYDKLLSVNVPGRDGFATVHFAAFHCAIRADVEILFRPSGGEKHEQELDDFYGTIVAYYGRPFECSSSDHKKCFRFTLFNRPSSKPLKLKYFEPIPLLRPILAVPAWSSLVIEAHLFGGDTKVEILKGVTPELLAKQRSQTFLEGNGFTAQFSVKWRLPRTEEDME